MILGIQLLGILFAIIMMYLSFLHYKRGEYSVKIFGSWMVLWVGFGIIALFPTLLDSIVTTLDFSRRMDFFIVVGFMVVLACVFINYSLLKKNQRKLEDVVRKISIEQKK